MLNQNSCGNKAGRTLCGVPAAPAPGTVLWEVALGKGPAPGKDPATLSKPCAPLPALPDRHDPLSAAVYLS